MIMIVALIAVGCSIRANTEVESKKIVSVATVQPVHHPINQGLSAFEAYIEKHLSDKFEVRVYTDGVIGSNSEALELLQLGSLDMVATSGSDLEAYANEYKIFSLPYVFEDEENFREVMKKEEFNQLIYDSTVDKGIQGVGWFANGVNNFYSKKKIETPADLRGLKIRVQPSEANVRMVNGFNAAATVLAYGEIYTAMQSNVIDVASNPEMALVDMKHGEVANYYSRTEHQIFTDMFVTTPSFMENLSGEEEEIFEEGFKLSTQVANNAWDARIEEAIIEAEDMGLEFVTPDKSLFEEVQAPVREKMLQEYSELQPLYEIIRESQE
ncbi:TRAP transporter substrate-binding protein DctP [Salinicoccus sesuvii]|uniref:TRAP transporter substrate-binding protein DctP n=2 Tax=Salinicoccus sesuvii TaxID=868281 RepID=A0ABV7N4S5_9STAP